MGILEDEIRQKIVTILLMRGEDQEGNAIFAYVALRADKLEEFMAAQANGNFDPEDYGVIIEAGEGEPSPELRKKMEEQYGFNHAGMQDIHDGSELEGVLDQPHLFKHDDDDLYDEAGDDESDDDDPDL